MGSGGRMERAMAPYGQEWVEGRRCGLFGRRLWGDLSMVAEVVWVRDMRREKCLSWVKRRMDW